MVWLYLAIAIIAEVMATTALKFSEGFTKLVPTVIVGLGYLAAFFFLSKVLNQLSISVAYAIWSGLGVALVALVGWIWLGQKLDAGALMGIGLIVGGVLVLNLFSNTVSH